MDIKTVLESDFIFKKWSSYKKESDNFNDTLDNFLSIEVYKNFREFVETNIHLFENEGKTNLEILRNETIFNDFMESVYTSNFNYLLFDNINKPFLFTTISNEYHNLDTRFHFITLEDIKNEFDLIAFINEVLKDIGEVTHTSGLKNEYEVVEVVDNRIYN